MQHARNDEPSNGPCLEGSGCGSMVGTPGGMEGVIDSSLGGAEDATAVGNDSVANKNVVLLGLMVDGFRLRAKIDFGHTSPK